MKSLSHVRIFVTPWTVAYHSPLSMGFSREEYWSGLTFPSPENIPDPGIEPGPPSEPPWKSTSLPRPWDSPGKNTGVGCHFLLQSRKVKSESEVAQPCPTLRDPMDCSLPGSSVHGIFQARVLEWGAIAFSEWYTKIHCL